MRLRTVSIVPAAWWRRTPRAGLAPRLTGWQLEAVQSLFLDPIVLQHDEDEDTTWYVNGQHRGRSMRDASVARTITAVDELVAPDQPADRR